MSAHRSDLGEKDDRKRESHGTSTRAARMSGGTSAIALSCIFITLPMIAFSVVLLILVFKYQVLRQESPFQHLRGPGSELFPSSAYYVNISSTRLIFIASWSSTLAPALTGSILLLFSYPISKNYLRHTKSQNVQSLLTPYQFALLLKFFNGSAIGAVWNWLKYRFFWRGKRQKQAPALSSAVLLTLLAIFLGFLVLAADTWLHITTKTVSLSHITKVLSSSANYSMSLKPTCINETGARRTDALEKCSIYRSVSGGVLLAPDAVLQAFNNISDSRRVLMHEEYAYLGVPPSDTLSQHDYRASTWAVKTECHPISRECGLQRNPADSGMPFNCGPGFQGDVNTATILGVSPKWMTAFFNDSTMASNISYESTGVGNPFYFGLAAEIGRTGAPTNDTDQIVIGKNGAAAFVIGCNSTVYDLVYDSVNGSVVRFNVNPSNESVTNIFQGSGARTGFGTDFLYLQQAAWLAIREHTAVRVAEEMAFAFSRAFAATGSGSVVPAAAVDVQRRTSTLAAEIQKAPLFSLVAANLLFVALGLVATFLALASHRSDMETTELQARFTIEGLVADRFEGVHSQQPVSSVDELFVENTGRNSGKVTIDRIVNQGYGYKILVPPSHGRVSRRD